MKMKFMADLSRTLVYLDIGKDQDKFRLKRDLSPCMPFGRSKLAFSAVLVDLYSVNT